MVMRSSTKFVCQQCGYSQVGWAGKCPSCEAWGSLVETTVSEGRKGRESSRRKDGKAEIVELSNVKSSVLSRISTGILELDRVLGGGLLPGQVILLAGEPGIGKSTLLLQVADKIQAKSVFYVAGEESSNQIKFRATRLGIPGAGINVIEETDVDAVIDQLGTSASIIIVDSIQTLTTEDLSGMAGSIGQVRETASRLASFGKSLGIPVFLVGHVTKEGAVAGPQILSHMVDTVLWFEGDRSQALRILRSVKNRFGPTDEAGIFTMEEKGLVAVSDPSSLFTSNVESVPGQVKTVVLEGTRPLALEIQALAVPTKLPYPRRVLQGVDSRRVELILAVLTRRAGLPLGNFDVFVNAAGGVQVKEPAADLAIALALVSSWANKPLPRSLVAFGEVGLLGEIRAVPQEARRVKEARRLGLRVIVSSAVVKTVGEAIKKF